MTGRKLILVRHSAPAIQPGVPAEEWPLSEEGRTRCQALAEWLAPFQLAAIAASREPKATETAHLVAERLGLAGGVRVVAGLHEHERRTLPYYDSRQEFEARVAAFFARPDELVLGEETAVQARDRFVAAVERIVRKTPAGNLAVVAHGTVITLLVAHFNRLDPMPFWRGLALPDSVTLSLPGYKL